MNNFRVGFGFWALTCHHSFNHVAYNRNFLKCSLLRHCAKGQISMGPIRSRFYIPKGHYSDKSKENITIVVSYVLQNVFFLP